MPKPKIVDVTGQEIGGYNEKIEKLEKRMAYIEQACSLYGTVFTILKRFFDAIPGADTMRKDQVSSSGVQNKVAADTPEASDES